MVNPQLKVLVVAGVQAGVSHYLLVPFTLHRLE
jgi:phage shock protein PspC (stress-responsive transcriptional regulator)